jgi:hypothetical protein
MTRTGLAAVIVTVLIMEGQVAAQSTIGTGAYSPFNPYIRPRFGYTPPAVYSPYLNLLQGGGTTIGNYFGMVQPQMQFRSSIFGLQEGLLNAQTPASGGSNTGVFLTGHGAGYMTHTRYFMTTTGGTQLSPRNPASRTGASGQRGGGQTQTAPGSRPATQPR